MQHSKIKYITENGKMNDPQALKFKKLVELCVETKNYKKIAAITLAMIASEARSHLIALNLPLSPKASIYEMMVHINTRLKVKHGIMPYKDSIITQIKLIEKLMERGKGNIPVKFIQDAIALYFDLHQISLLPFKSIVDDSPSMFSKEKGLFSRFNQSKSNETLIQQLITDELSSRETLLRSRIEAGSDENALQELHKISCLKESLVNNKKKKIQINGLATQDQRYSLFFAQSKAYPLLGTFFLLTCLSVLVLTQMILNLELLTSLGTFFLMFAGASAFSLYLYFLVKKKVVQNPW